MEKEKQVAINNPHLHDSSGKLIFGDNILCAQFLRDYADLEILKNVLPEDIEDVSERYVLLYSTQRDSDIVKKVNIAKYMSAKDDENPLGLPLYVVSLIEHKTKVEYNVCMQIFRYMYCIWDDYEKEMEKIHPGISVRKDFKYPPILPIVYYEGTEKWTAPLELSERILCRKLLGNYLPHFTYQVVRLHDYSNEELLERGDEISLAMLVNKIRGPEDVELFTKLPQEKVDGILRNTPAYLLEVMAKVTRALFYHMEIPEDETEKAVAKIKERKMGMLFEGVTFSYREEMEKMRAEREKIQVESEKIQAEREKIQAESERMQGERERMREEREEIQAEHERKMQALQLKAEQEIKISHHVVKMISHGHSADEIKRSLSQEFGFSAQEAEEKFRELTE